MSDKIKQTLNELLELFRSGNIPEAVVFAAFPQFKVPSNKWSYFNRIIMSVNDTHDARGFKQWLEAGRNVKKGAKAFYIFAPRIAKKKDKVDESELLGFLEVPVFRVQDTEGEPLDYERTKINSFPFIEIAKEWGLSVQAIGENSDYWGAYDGKEIKLATPEEKVFFHELSHAAHKIVLLRLKTGQDWKQEIVAELSAAALCRLVGLKKDTTGNSYQYIEMYAKEAGLTPVNACLQVLGDVERVIRLIIGRVGDDENKSDSADPNGGQKEETGNHQS